MTPELMFWLVGLLIVSLSGGAALAWLIVAGQASLRTDLGERMGMLEARMSTVETGLSVVQRRLLAVETRMSVVERELGRTQGQIDGLRSTPTGAAAAD